MYGVHKQRDELMNLTDEIQCELCDAKEIFTQRNTYEQHYGTLAHQHNLAYICPDCRDEIINDKMYFIKQLQKREHDKK